MAMKARKLRAGYKKLTVEKAYILGVLCGDGYVSINKPRVGLSCTSGEFINEFVKCGIKQYGLKPSIWTRKKCDGFVSFPVFRIIKAKKDIISAVFNSRELLNDILRFENFKTNSWCVPNQIMKSNKTIIHSFLKGLYDSDGSAGHHVNLSSNSKKGLDDVRELLVALGIDSFSTHITGTDTCYVLGIHNRKGKELFQKYIDFRIPFRKRRLKENLSKYKSKRSYSTNRVKSLYPDILRLRQEKKLSSRQIARRLGIGKTTVLRHLSRYNLNKAIGE